MQRFDGLSFVFAAFAHTTVEDVPLADAPGFRELQIELIKFDGFVIDRPAALADEVPVVVGQNIISRLIVIQIHDTQDTFLYKKSKGIIDGRFGESLSLSGEVRVDLFDGGVNVAAIHIVK